MSELLFNELPRPTFRWLRVNHTPVSLWGESEEIAAPVIDGKDSIITSLPAGTALINTNYKGANEEALRALINECEVYRIQVPANAKETVYIRIDGSHRVGSRFQFVVEEGAELEVLFYLEGTAKEATNIQYFNEYDVHANAKIVVKKINLLGETVQHIEHRYTKLADGAEAECINVEIGGQENLLNYDHDLQGNTCNMIHDIAYLGNKEQKFDFSLVMTHGGKKSVSDIHTLGALSDTAKKSFRGTLDFLRGATGSEGAEEDTCLLLDPTVKSISLPLLLCKEDNVSGNHAASAGQIDANKLFYLMSRGFNEAEAKHMIVESMIRPIIDRIGDEAIEEAALNAVRNKI